MGMPQGFETRKPPNWMCWLPVNSLGGVKIHHPAQGTILLPFLANTSFPRRNSDGLSSKKSPKNTEEAKSSLAAFPGAMTL